MGGLSTAYLLIPAQAARWRKAAVAAGAIATRRVRHRVVRAVIAARRAVRRLAVRAHARALDLSSTLTRQRHGTWLILFGLLFTLLWLLAGWIGMANGIWRGMLVGIATPLAVGTLFPLRRPVR